LVANRLTKVGDVVYTWDARGNLSNDGVFTYTYNAAGRMVRAQSVTATLVYTYNHSGLRVAQSVESHQSAFSWDWATGVPEMLSDGDALYLVGHETLGQWDGAWSYYLPDALGSVRQATDGAGTVVSAREWFDESTGLVLVTLVFHYPSLPSPLPQHWREQRWVPLPCVVRQALERHCDEPWDQQWFQVLVDHFSFSPSPLIHPGQGKR
jgi:hypothetical protein